MSGGKPPALVADEEILHRAVPAGSSREDKPHYMAFYSSTEPWRISVDRATYRTLEESLAGWPTCGAAALQVGAVRELAFEPHLTVESVPENDNDAHAEIVVAKATSKNAVKTKVCAKLAEISTMVRQPVKPPPAE
jgi:hypothetical protein